jgi:hypothetical protein
LIIAFEEFFGRVQIFGNELTLATPIRFFRMVGSTPSHERGGRYKQPREEPETTRYRLDRRQNQTIVRQPVSVAVRVISERHVLPEGFCGGRGGKRSIV